MARPRRRPLSRDRCGSRKTSFAKEGRETACRCGRSCDAVLRESKSPKEEEARSSPLVRKIAREHGVNLSQVSGTGLGGRITKQDILSFIEGTIVRASLCGARNRAANAGFTSGGTCPGPCLSQAISFP